MKAVIVELKSKYAVALSDAGHFQKLNNNGYYLGQVIELNQKQTNISRKIAYIAASAAALLIITTGSWAYASPYTYVSLDVNPSLEFTVNRFNRVLSVKAINDDGEELLKDIEFNDFYNKPIIDALSQTVKQISDLGYFEGEIEGALVITTFGKNNTKAEELAHKLQDSVTKEKEETDEDIFIEAYSVGLEQAEEAKMLGVTPGKLNLVKKLQESIVDSENIDLNEWLNKPVNEIISATKENEKSAKIQNKLNEVADKELKDQQKTTDKELKDQQKTTDKELKDQQKAINKELKDK